MKEMIAEITRGERELRRKWISGECPSEEIYLRNEHLLDDNNGQKTSKCGRSQTISPSWNIQYGEELRFRKREIWEYLCYRTSAWGAILLCQET